MSDATSATNATIAVRGKQTNPQPKTSKCEYWHEWRKIDTEPVTFTCNVCGYTPKKDSKEYDKAQAILLLRAMLKPGDTVYTILNHVSRSGMQRRISLCIGDGKAVNNITWDVAHALGEPIKNRAGYVQDVGISVGGCGMDMGFHMVYNLSRVLFRNGFVCAGKSCPSNDHFNDPKCKRSTFAGKMHEGDGGYALNHRWL